MMNVDLMIAVTLISALGLPHGALDPWVAWRSGLVKTSRGMVLFLCLYIALCILGLIGWYLSPTLALIVFLGYSAIHFGRDQAGRCVFGGAPYGLVVIGVPSLFRPSEVQSIYAALTAYDSSGLALSLSQASLVLGVIGLAYSWFVSYHRGRAQDLSWFSLEVSALFILAYVAEPLWYFVVFFCALHSPRHLASEYQLASARQRLIALGVMSFFTLVTVGITLMIGERYYAELKSLEALTHQAIFIGLSVLTIPHMCLMEWMRVQPVSTSLDVSS